MIHYSEIIQRRQKLLDALPDHSIAIIPSACETIRNRDSAYRFRQNSHFYYLTLFNEANAVLVLIKEGKAHAHAAVFVESRNPLIEQWTGERLGPERAVEALAVEQAYPVASIHEHLPEWLKSVNTVYFPFYQSDYWGDQLNQWLKTVNRQSGRYGQQPEALNDLAPLIAELRLYKSEAEINCLRQASSIAAKAHKRAMRHCKPGMGEFELEAELVHEFKRHGPFEYAYNPIVASGANACILHYEHNHQYCEDNALVLIDAGVEYGYYASDITRTFPANGQFSQAQRAIYDIVLNAQKTIIDKIEPGVRWYELNELAIRLLTEGLVSIGVLNESVEQAIAKTHFRAYYPHQVGHWLGLDVHDVGAYKVDGKWRQLEQGMVFTIEPGLYIPEDDLSPYRGIGVRIEDDILVTEQGCDVLTRDVPKEIRSIEAIMSGEANE